MAEKNVLELLQIGLTEGEAKVYLALSELGSSTVGPIVKKGAVAYSNVYDILNRLIEKGIVSFIIKDKTHVYQAVSPSNLIEFLSRKEDEIKEQKKALHELIPKLEKLQNLAPQQKAEIFIGKKGLRTAYDKLYDNIPRTGSYFFYIHKPGYSKESDLFYFSIWDLLMSVSQRGIGNRYSKGSPFMKRFGKSKNVRLKYVDFPIPGNIEVCGNKILLISWEKGISATLVHSLDLALNLREYFENAWKIAKS